jgi:hypothetical protein
MTRKRFEELFEKKATTLTFANSPTKQNELFFLRQTKNFRFKSFSFQKAFIIVKIEFVFQQKKNAFVNNNLRKIYLRKQRYSL